MVFEVVSGQILLAKRKDFQKLHSEVLMPACTKAEINLVLCLMTEVGNVGKFIDIYQYNNYVEYDSKTNLLESFLWEVGYYEEIQKCITGSISVELMNKFYPSINTNK